MGVKLFAPKPLIPSPPHSSHDLRGFLHSRSGPKFAPAAQAIWAVVSIATVITFATQQQQQLSPGVKAFRDDPNLNLLRRRLVGLQLAWCYITALREH